jgi:hypothetical protein
MVKLETLEDVKNDAAKDGQKVEEVNILFLDSSSTCTGYSIMKVNFEKKTCRLTSCGVLWLNNREWRDQQRYSYMFHALSGYFWVVEGVDYIVAEQYSINPKKMIGAQVLPELMGVIKAAAEENGINCSTILPQTWRSQLGIKPNVSSAKDGKNKRDYKSPTKDKVLEYFNIPETSISNITGKERATPSDLYDAIAIGLGWTKKYGISNLVTGEFTFNGHIGQLGKK